ncbi:hypothetical protein H5410_044419 [Solanum commersonii]|uniref:Uncharacterized protein n=1 Tax=Solanum commersonii TaxID=4109 RepID=A0A9J5X6R3_SOLCO|nr:hypothetical protein H5410_044419 [Solanum commersonii]
MAWRRPTFLLANRGFQVHGQVLITSWVVIAILLGSTTIVVEPTNHSDRGLISSNMFLNPFEISFTLENHTITSWGVSAPTNDINTLLLWLYSHPWHISTRSYKKGLADELVVVVLVSLVPLVVPIPVMLLGLFTSGIQALIFATLAAYIVNPWRAIIEIVFLA